MPKTALNDTAPVTGKWSAKFQAVLLWSTEALEASDANVFFHFLGTRKLSIREGRDKASSSSSEEAVTSSASSASSSIDGVGEGGQESTSASSIGVSESLPEASSPDLDLPSASCFFFFSSVGRCVRV